MYKHKQSFIRKTALILTVETVLIVIALLSFVGYSYVAAYRNMEKATQDLGQIYSNELNNKIENAEILMERIIYNNSAFDMLQSAQEADRVYASIELKELIKESITFDKHVDAVVIAESTYETCLDSDSGSMAYEEREALRAFTMECAKQIHIPSEWKIGTIGENDYLYLLIVWQGKATGIYMRTEGFMNVAAESELQSMSILLTDEEHRIWNVFGQVEEDTWEKGGLLEEYISNRALVRTFEIADGKIELSLVVQLAEMLNQIRTSVFFIFGVILCVFITICVLARCIYQDMLLPMSHMRKSMEQIQDGDYELRIEEEYSGKEFSLLKDTFNQLMNEIVGLKIKAYEKQIELSENELKCVKLQIRPHFFLNAMTTISSLSQQGLNDKINVYIEALSKNIRYMFRSGLHTVTLQEEIRHVENYFEMQELKYPGCVFHFIEIEAGIEEYKIPQMLIHTIIENEYKYAVSMDTMLTILIHASRSTYEGLEVLKLQIEDDGKGYPAEVIEQINEAEVVEAKDGSRIGLWSLKRMMELMYDRKNLFKISNVEPHGCKNIFYIPMEPVHEIAETFSSEIERR